MHGPSIASHVEEREVPSFPSRTPGDVPSHAPAAAAGSALQDLLDVLTNGGKTPLRSSWRSPLARSLSIDQVTGAIPVDSRAACCCRIHLLSRVPLLTVTDASAF
jgi:hypothetical protein